MRLSDHCWAVTGLACIPPWTVNAGFLVGGSETLVIDTGANAAAAATIGGYAALAGPGNRLLVANTERHFDHIGGNSWFRDRGAEIFGHAGIDRTDEEFRAEIAEYNASIPNAARRERGEAACFFAGTTLALPNRPLTGGEAIDLGGLNVHVVATPGHTRSNLSYHLPSEHVLFCGDCLVNAYSPNLECGSAADWREWLESLDRLEALAPEVVVPGHGPVARGSEVRDLFEHVRSELRKALGG